MNIKNRLQQIEAKLAPKERPSISLGLECNDLTELAEIVEWCKRHNTPESGLFHHPIWTGEPSDEAAAMVAQVGYRPDNYQKHIHISNAEDDPTLPQNRREEPPCD